MRCSPQDCAGRPAVLPLPPGSDAQFILTVPVPERVAFDALYRAMRARLSHLRLQGAPRAEYFQVGVMGELRTPISPASSTRSVSALRRSPHCYQAASGRCSTAKSIAGVRDWRHWLAFGLGSGLARYAPGTFGTLVAIPLYLVLAQLPPWLYGVTVIAAFALGVWPCDIVSRDLGVHDHGGIVWDEFVGYWITMFMIPPDWLWILAGFALFRLFDIWKPWPIRWFDRQRRRADSAS